MPSPTNRQSGQVIEAADINALAAVANTGESQSATAITQLAGKATTSQVVTGGSTRVSGGAFHFFNNPSTTPVGPQAGDVWIGDITA